MGCVRKPTEGASYVLFIAVRAQKVGYQSKQVFSQAKVELLFWLAHSKLCFLRPVTKFYFDILYPTKTYF